MEVIQLDDDDDDDFIQSVNPAATRKSNSDQAAASSSKTAKAFKRPPPIKTSIDSDPILKPSTSSSSIIDDECPICSRDLRLLNEQRRTLHLNACLDEGEAKTDFDKSMDKWRSTMDCPVCKTPLAAGPFRNAHIKKCGRAHAINGRDLLTLVNTQEKVAETRRKRALPHTSAKTPKLRPKKVSKLDGEPKSMAEEELIMAKALSASIVDPSEAEREEEELRSRKDKEREKAAVGVSPQFTRIINENIRKRRSYAVVELAPRGCKCDVIELIQSRFLRVFRGRRKVLKKAEKKRAEDGTTRKGNEAKEEERVKERLAAGEQSTLRRVEMEASMASTLARLDSLSWAYRKLAAEAEAKGDVRIACSDGEIRAFSWALAARTTALGRGAGEAPKISIDQPSAVVRHWLQYVTCARVEWTQGPENDGMRDIAKQYGPEGLAEECARMNTSRREYRGFGRIAAVVEQQDDTVAATVVPPPATVPSEHTVPPAEAPAEEPEVVQPIEQAPLPSDDARQKEKMEEGEEEGTVDSEGSMSAALKKCAADGHAAARLSSKPRPLDDSFLAALAAPPPAPPPIAVETTVVTPTTVPLSQSPPPQPQESPKDSFFESIVYGEKQTPPPPTVVPPSTVLPLQQPPVDPSESAESMDESDAMRNILDVSCLRRSPRIRVDGEQRKEAEVEEEEGRTMDDGLSPVLFDDSDDCVMERPEEGAGGGGSQRVPSPRRSPRRSFSQSISAAQPDTVTPRTSRPSALRKSMLGQKKQQEVIYLEDTPVSSPVTVAKPIGGTISIAKKEEEATVDETFPRADQPSYGQGGVDTVDAGGELEENRPGSPMEDGGDGGGDYDYHYDDNGYGDDWDGDWGGGGGGGEEREEAEEGARESVPPTTTTTTAARAQEEVDSFLQSLRFNDSSRAKSASPPTAFDAAAAPRPAEEVDSFLISFMGAVGKRMETEEEEGTADILGALSPMRKEAEAAREAESGAAFKTPTVRGTSRGRGGATIGRAGRGGAVFGSHVKVLKWSNVTPKPRFEAMDDDALKSQLARYGLRPMGRKRAIATLSEIYEQTHPVVDESAAAASSSSSSDAVAGSSTGRKDTVSKAGGVEVSPTRKKRSTVAEEEDDEENDGERTLNRGADSSFEDNSDEREGTGGVGEAEESMVIPKAVLKGADSQLVLFLEWLREPSQKDLYDHCLALKSISLEELEVKLKRADSALCGISRKVLMCVLDRLHITYSLPQDGWKKKRKGK